jgi:bacteriocin-like protein
MNTELELTINELDAVSGGSLPLPAIVATIVKKILADPPPPPCGAAAGMDSWDHPIHPC